MRKKKKQVRAYSLGGLLFVLLLVVIIALLVGGIITIPKLQDGIFKTYRAAGANTAKYHGHFVNKSKKLCPCLFKRKRLYHIAKNNAVALTVTKGL